MSEKDAKETEKKTPGSFGSRLLISIYAFILRPLPTMVNDWIKKELIPQPVLLLLLVPILLLVSLTPIKYIMKISLNDIWSFVFARSILMSFILILFIIVPLSYIFFKQCRKKEAIIPSWYRSLFLLLFTPLIMTSSLALLRVSSSGGDTSFSVTIVHRADDQALYPADIQRAISKTVKEIKGSAESFQVFDIDYKDDSFSAAFSAALVEGRYTNSLRFVVVTGSLDPGKIASQIPRGERNSKVFIGARPFSKPPTLLNALYCSQGIAEEIRVLVSELSHYNVDARTSVAILHDLSPRAIEGSAQLEKAVRAQDIALHWLRPMNFDKIENSLTHLTTGTAKHGEGDFLALFGSTRTVSYYLETLRKIQYHGTVVLFSEESLFLKETNMPDRCWVVMPEAIFNRYKDKSVIPPFESDNVMTASLLSSFHMLEDKGSDILKMKPQQFVKSMSGYKLESGSSHDLGELFVLENGVANVSARVRPFYAGH